MSNIKFFDWSGRTLWVGLVVLCSLLAACGPSSDRVRIKGNIKGLADAELYIYSETGNSASIDTIHVHNDQFDYQCPCTEAQILTILFPSLSTLPVIAEGGETIKITGDGNRLAQIAVSGTDANADFSALRQRIAAMSKSDQQREAATFVRANPKSPAALLTLWHYFARQSPMPVEPLKGLLQLLRQSQGRDPMFVAIESALSPLLRLAVGAHLPDFKCETLSGQPFDSRHLKGSPVLLYVRASWAQADHDLTSTIRALRHNNPRHYQVVVLNLDTDAASAQRVMDYDSLQVYTTLCDVRGITSPLVSQLGLNVFPCVILTDAQGRITKVCTDGAELRRVLM